MTSAMTLQRLYQLSYQANWELVILGVCNLPVNDELKNMNLNMNMNINILINIYL